MTHFANLLVLTTMLAVAYSYPFQFGGGISAKTHSEFGGDAIVNAELDNGAAASAKGRGFFDWIGSFSGGAFIGNEKGEGFGMGGTSGAAVGGGVKAKGTLGADGTGKDTLEGHGGLRGDIDKEGHANVFGNVDTYDSDKIKDLVNRNNRYSSKGYKSDKDNDFGARSFGSEDW